IGWVTHDPPATTQQYSTSLLSMSLAAVGALLSAWRPAWGFLLLGAGYVAGAISMAVLRFPEIDSLPPAAGLLGVGIWYSRLGFKELGDVATETGEFPSRGP
ncbi:MAG TPA: hypothetical protein VM222_06355, partial [Planctomycetota bacterium]|nr:hypothetical protein [Planctomycetota bacterium]